MILKLVEALSTQILKYYPEYEIINDKIEQNFGKTIHITALPVLIKRIMGERYNINTRLIITIFNDNIDEIMNMCENMYHVLEILDFGNKKIRGMNFSFSIQNNAGVIDITYNVWTYHSKEEIKMKNIEYRGGVFNERKERE